MSRDFPFENVSDPDFFRNLLAISAKKKSNNWYLKQVFADSSLRNQAQRVLTNTEFEFYKSIAESAPENGPHSRPPSAQSHHHHHHKRVCDLAEARSPGASPISHRTPTPHNDDIDFKTAFKPRPMSARPGSSASASSGVQRPPGRPSTAMGIPKAPPPRVPTPSAGFVDPSRSLGDALRSLSDAKAKNSSPDPQAPRPGSAGTGGGSGSGSLLLRVAKDQVRKEGIVAALKKRGFMKDTPATQPSKAEIMHRLFVDAQSHMANIHAKIQTLDAYSDEFLQQEMTRTMELSKLLSSENALVIQGVDIDTTDLAGHDTQFARIPGYENDLIQDGEYTDSDETFSSMGSPSRGRTEGGGGSKSSVMGSPSHGSGGGEGGKRGSGSGSGLRRSMSGGKIGGSGVGENENDDGLDDVETGILGGGVQTKRKHRRKKGTVGNGGGGDDGGDSEDLESESGFTDGTFSRESSPVQTPAASTAAGGGGSSGGSGGGVGGGGSGMNRIVPPIGAELVQTSEGAFYRTGSGKLIPATAISGEAAVSGSAGAGLVAGAVGSAGAAAVGGVWIEDLDAWENLFVAMNDFQQMAAYFERHMRHNLKKPELNAILGHKLFELIARSESPMGRGGGGTENSDQDISDSEQHSPKMALKRLKNSAKNFLHANAFVNGVQNDLAAKIRNLSPTSSSGNLAKRKSSVRLMSGAAGSSSPHRSPSPKRPNSAAPGSPSLPSQPSPTLGPRSGSRSSRLNITASADSNPDSASSPIESNQNQFPSPTRSMSSLFSPLNQPATPMQKLKERLRIVTRNSLAMDNDPRLIMLQGPQGKLAGATQWVTKMHKFCESLLQITFTALEEVEKQTLALAENQHQLGGDERVVFEHTVSENAQIKDEIETLKKELEEEKRVTSTLLKSAARHRSIATQTDDNEESAVEMLRMASTLAKAKDRGDWTDPENAILASRRATDVLTSFKQGGMGGGGGGTGRNRGGGGANRLSCPNQRLMDLWERSPLDKRRPKDLTWLVKNISSFLRCKVLADAADDRDKRRRSTLAEFVFENLRQLFGAKSIVDDNVVRLVASLFKFEPEDVLVRSFFRMLREEWPTHVLNMFLSVLIFLFVHKHKTANIPVLFANPNLDVTAPMFLSRTNVLEIIKYLSSLGFFTAEEPLITAVLPLCFPPTSVLGGGVLGGGGTGGVPPRPGSAAGKGAVNKLAMARQLSMQLGAGGGAGSSDPWDMEPELDEDRVNHVDFLFYLCDKVWSLGLVPSGAF